MRPVTKVVSTLLGPILGAIIIAQRDPPAAVSAEAPTEFYVSTRGNDNWSGTRPDPNPQGTDGPFATVERARDAVRGLQARGPLASPVTVYIRGGMYSTPRPLVFHPGDSGTPQYRITYKAYQNEVPILSGGRTLSGWRRLARGDRLLPRQASGAALPRESDIWVADVAEAKGGKWYFHQLFVNGKRRQRARSPNAGYFFADGRITPDAPATFKYHPGDIKRAWAERGEVEVVALLKWAEFRLPIKSVDEAARAVTLAGKRQPFGDDQNPRYWVENSLDALDAPGEWYLDREAGMVYYWPMSGEDLGHAEVVAPFLEQLIRLEGDEEAGRFVHDLDFEGLTLGYTDWSMPRTGYVDTQAAYELQSAVEGVAAHSCGIIRCELSHLGQYAVAFGRGSKENRIVGNRMWDLGAGGVKLGDPKDPNYEDQETRGNVVSDNRIRDIGQVFPAAVGVWIGESSHNRIAHNEIADTYYTGISVGWTWGYGPTAARENVIEFNHIHDIGRGMLSDLGCIYTLGVQPGTVERNNLCHDVTRYERGYGGWGFYTDEGSSEIVIENNVVHDAQDGGFHQHYGARNVVRNNVFGLGRTAQLRRTRNEDHLSFTFEHNIVYWKDGELLDGRWDDNNFKFDYNLYFRLGGAPVVFGGLSLDAWRNKGQDRHSLVADPSFVDLERRNFSLKPDSPAIELGFAPIDLSSVGPR